MAGLEKALASMNLKEPEEGIVFKIECRICHHVYIGQTKDTLKKAETNITSEIKSSKYRKERRLLVDHFQIGNCKGNNYDFEKLKHIPADKDKRDQEKLKFIQKYQAENRSLNVQKPKEVDVDSVRQKHKKQ